MKLHVVALGLAGALALTVACGHDDDHSHGPGGHTSQYPSCQAIIDACHPLDVGEGPAHDCHDLAHAPSSTEASCAAEKDACLQTKCVAGPADAGADG